MFKKQEKQRNIKTKLMAAVCMLLVATIMLVSTTYAWFTLSTAPEVKGITTAVGANGNLEMALLPKDGQFSSITSSAGDAVLDWELRNTTWGNLVDVSDTTVYGLDKIALYPAALNAATQDANGNPLTLADAMLKSPTYGADGRVSELVANTVTGFFDKQTQTFSPNDYKGVRAVGTASGMTDRQLDYRNARSAANTAKAQAANQAAQSLNTNGSALANIAIAYGMNGADASFNKDNVQALRSIIDDLKNTDGVLDRIESAYIQYILAFAASAASGEEDTVWQAVKGAVNAEGATLNSIISTAGADKLPEALNTAVEKYNTMVAAVAEADAELQALEARLEADETATFTWNEIRVAMTPLADPTAMLINGFKASDVKENLGELVSSVTSQGGLKVIMQTGAGVYADVADQCGDYNASINIDKVVYNGIVLENMAARMETASGIKPPYLDAIGTVVSAAGAPEGTGSAVLPITDMYGYIIDMAFRTNASDSKLLLQADAADRIYTGNSNEETMGSGSTMTFAATTTDFTNDQVKGLMRAIRIVFFDPMNDNQVVATAKLDVDNATLGADGITAKIYLYTITSGETTYRLAGEGETATHKQNIAYVESTEGLYMADAAAEGGYRLITDADADVTTKYAQEITYTEASVEDGAAYLAEVTASGETKSEDNAIMALTQNQATALSALVYLDGENVGNDDVAATAAQSMTGKMNLQFASSATLVPMDYSALNIPAATTE